MLTADQARARGIKIGAQDPAEAKPVVLPADMQELDASAAIIPAGVKVYTINRSVDAADPEIMHEEHVIYRRESSPRWRLDAPAGQKILVGPRVTDGQQDLKPILDKELTTFLNDQRRVAQANQQAIGALFQAVDALNRQQQALIRRELKNSAKPDAAAAEKVEAETAPAAKESNSPETGATNTEAKK